MTRRLLLPSARQTGVTLTELMIALVLGALVVLAATAMVVTSRGTYRTQDEATRLSESARFGLELGNRLVRLAGYTNFGDDTTPPASYTLDSTWTVSPNSYALNGPNIVGTNSSKPTPGAVVNGSDSLTIRFFGSSPPGSTLPDGNVLDCAGTPVPQAPTATAASATASTVVNNAARSYNVLFVDLDTDGEPALKCQKQSYDPTTGLALATLDAPQTLIRGVEDFQVLYGELIAQPFPNDDLDLPGNAPAADRLSLRHRRSQPGREVGERAVGAHRDAVAQPASGTGFDGSRQGAAMTAATPPRAIITTARLSPGSSAPGHRRRSPGAGRSRSFGTSPTATRRGRCRRRDRPRSSPIRSTARNISPATVEPSGVASPSVSTRPIGSRMQKTWVNSVGKKRYWLGSGVPFSRSIPPCALVISTRTRSISACWIVSSQSRRTASAMRRPVPSMRPLAALVRASAGSASRFDRKRSTSPSCGWRRSWQRSV